MSRQDQIRESATADTGVADKKAEETKNLSPENDPNFKKHYNKELRVSQDEVPIVLNDLNDSALKYINREQYDIALVLFQKAHGIINVISLDHCRRDQHLAFLIFHNMAACYQRMNSLDEWAVAIENALLYLGDYSSLKSQSISQRMVYMEKECKIRMQLCALLSQLHRHRDALDQAKHSIKLIHMLFKDLDALCKFYILKSNDEELDLIEDHLQQRNESLNDNYTAFYESISKMMAKQPELAILASKNWLDEGVSLMEKAAKKIFPVIKEVNKRLVKEKKRSSVMRQKKGSNALFNFKDNGKEEGQNVLEVDKEIEELIQEDDDDYDYEDIINPQLDDSDMELEEKLDMRAVLGYFNQSEWIGNINIGNIMQINPYKNEEFMSTSKNEFQLCRNSFLEKISLLAVAYFWASTEIRFILQLNEDPTFKKKDKEPESEYWHAKSLEIAWCFLPADCPLVNHILLSYQKHHSPAQQPISEDKANEDQLEWIKPLNGIESNKFQPLIRKVENINVLLTPADLSPAYKITGNLLKSYKDCLIKYISGEESRDPSAKREASATSQKHTKHTHSNAMAVEEYNNFENMRNSYSVNTNFDSRAKSLIDNILINKNMVIEILKNKSNNDEKQTMLKKLLEEFEPARMPLEENRLMKENHVSSGNIEHTKSMGVGDESHDSLLCDEDAPNKNLKDKMQSHSFHKRPLSQNNMLRSKSSRQNKRRKKTPVGNNRPQNSLISNTENTNSKATKDVQETEYSKNKKLIDDSKFGNKKQVVNASCRPKSSRGNRSFDSCGNNKLSSKHDPSIKHKRSSMSGVSKTSTNFGKKKNSYGCAGQFNADKILAKYRQVRNTGNVSNSFSANIENPNGNFVTSIREKNSRNIEKFGDKGIMNSNSKMEVKESNSQYLINSESIKGDSITHNMSFDVNQRQRVLKPKKKKEEATKALLNFEDMKRKILKDYVKKNGKDIGPNIPQPSHHRNGAGIMAGYFSQIDETGKRKDLLAEARNYATTDDDVVYSKHMNGKSKKGSK